MIRLLLKTEKEVEKILEEVPITRTSDNLLYVEYWRRHAPTIPFFQFWEHPRRYKCAVYKTVERNRRKVQERRPELKEGLTGKLREIAEEAYYEYSRGG